MDYICRIKHTISEHQMLCQGDSVLIAVSGGPDSVALLDGLSTLSKDFRFNLSIAHVNHCLRGENSDRDEEFVTVLSQRNGLPLFKRKIRVKELRKGKSLEEAARDERYAFLHEIAKIHGFNKIALGHHADDNAELFIMNLLRGAGLLGLSGIPPVRENLFVRPQIDIPKDAILDYLHEKGLEYVIDETNHDTTILRNRIRHEVIPYLKNIISPSVTNGFTRAAEIFRCEEDCWEKMTTPMLDEILIEKNNAVIWMDGIHFAGYHKAIKRRILRKAIFAIKQNLRRISASHIDAAMEFVLNGPAAGQIDLPDGIHILKDRERFGVCITTYDGLIKRGRKRNRVLSLNGHISAEYKEKPVYDYIVNGPGAVRIKEIGKTVKLAHVSPDNLFEEEFKNPNMAFVDMKELRFPLIIRNIRKGDRFIPLGMKGSQKVTDFFINRKIPHMERMKCPLILSNDEIIWVCGYRMADWVKIKPDTKNIMKFELCLA